MTGLTRISKALTLFSMSGWIQNEQHRSVKAQHRLECRRPAPHRQRLCHDFLATLSLRVPKSLIDAASRSISFRRRTDQDAPFPDCECTGDRCRSARATGSRAADISTGSQRRAFWGIGRPAAYRDAGNFDRSGSLSTALSSNGASFDDLARLQQLGARRRTFAQGAEDMKVCALPSEGSAACESCCRWTEGNFVFPSSLNP